MQIYMVLKFLTGRWSVGRWSVHLVGDQWSMIGCSVGRCSAVGGRLVGGFKETLFNNF